MQYFSGDVIFTLILVFTRSYEKYTSEPCLNVLLHLSLNIYEKSSFSFFWNLKNPPSNESKKIIIRDKILKFFASFHKKTFPLSWKKINQNAKKSGCLALNLSSNRIIDISGRVVQRPIWSGSRVFRIGR